MPRAVCIASSSNFFTGLKRFGKASRAPVKSKVIPVTGIPTRSEYVLYARHYSFNFESALVKTLACAYKSRVE